MRTGRTAFKVADARRAGLNRSLRYAFSQACRTALQLIVAAEEGLLASLRSQSHH